MIKVPPHSSESEQSVLWSILIDNECIIDIWDLLLASDFYDNHNKKIYDVIFDLYKEDRPIDLITVKEKLEDKKLLDKIWGITYLTELTEIVPTTSNVLEYAKIVKNKSILRQLWTSANKIMWFSFDEESDISELLENCEKSLFNVTQSFIKNKLTPIHDILTNRYEEFAEIHENPGLAENNRLQVWFKDIDFKLWWLKGWDMVILAARPSMWKTAFALNIAQNVWYKGKNVAIFSLEMSKEQLTDRMLSSAMWIDSWKLAKWELNDNEFSWIWDAMDKLSNAKIFIDDTAWWNLTELKSKCRRLKMESWLDLIIIDYLQLMSNWNSINRNQEISEISRWIKSLARELSVPIIALSQLSRAVETRPDKRPIMSDLRESGSLEQDADIVMMLYREEYYDEFTEKKWVTEIFIRKNRNWPIWNNELIFDKNNQRFLEIEKNKNFNEK